MHSCCNSPGYNSCNKNKFLPTALRASGAADTAAADTATPATPQPNCAQDVFVEWGANCAQNPTVHKTYIHSTKWEVIIMAKCCYLNRL